MLNLIRLALLTFLAFYVSGFELKDGPITIGERVKPHESAILQIESTTKGYLTPRMTTVQRDAIVNPADGLQIFNTDTGKLELYVSGVWSVAGGGGSDHPTWTPSTAYPEGTIVVDTTTFKVYRANTSHTSDATALANDIALGYWDELSDDLNRLPDGSVTDETIPRWDGTTGDDVQTSSVTISDTDDVGNVTSLAVGSASTDASSILDTTSTTQGSRPCPSMTEAQRDAVVSPVDGLCIYNTDTKKLNIYDSSALQWNSAGGGLAKWETGQAYKLYDTIWEEASEKIYYANTAHTSTVFATDIANWTELSDDLNRLANGTVTDETILRWDGTTGDDVQTSNITISDTDDIGNISSLIVGGASPDASSSMDVVSTTKGSRPCPSMTEAQRDAIVSPVDGLCIHNTDTKELNIYNAADSKWTGVGGGSPAGTAIIEGLLISQNTATTFDISAGSAVFVDYTTDPQSPESVIFENLAPITGITDSFPSDRITYLGINSSGTVLQQASDFTPTQLRSVARLGAIVKSAGSIILVSNNGVTVHSPINQIYDLATALGTIIDGGFFRASGANLQLARTASTALVVGGNRSTIGNPNFIDRAATDPVTLIGSYQNGIGGTTLQTGLTAIDPTLWDDGSGTLATVPTNKFTVIDLYYSSTVDDNIFTYGQNTYNTLADATSALLTREYIKPAGLANVPRRGWLIIRENVTNLQTALGNGNARLLDADIFGSGIAGAATISVTTLQKAYENSEQPEILLNTTRGALDIIAPVTDPDIPYFTVKSNDSLLEYFGVEQDGVHTTALVLERYASISAASATPRTEGKLLLINDEVYKDIGNNYIQQTGVQDASLWGAVTWSNLDTGSQVVTTGTGGVSEESITGGLFGTSAIDMELPVAGDTITIEVQAPYSAIDKRYNVTEINYFLFDHSSTVTLEVLDWNDNPLNSIELQNTGTGTATVSNLRYGTAKIDYTLPYIHGSSDRSVKFRFSSDANVAGGGFLLGYLQSDFEPRATGEWVEEGILLLDGFAGRNVNTVYFTSATADNISNFGTYTNTSSGFKFTANSSFTADVRFFANILSAAASDASIYLNGVILSQEGDGSASFKRMNPSYTLPLTTGDEIEFLLSGANGGSDTKAVIKAYRNRRSITVEGEMVDETRILSSDVVGITNVDSFAGLEVGKRYVLEGQVVASANTNLGFFNGADQVGRLSYASTGTYQISFNFEATDTTLDIDNRANTTVFGNNTKDETFFQLREISSRSTLAITLDEIRADGQEYPVFGKYIWVGTTKYQVYRRSYNITATGNFATGLPGTLELLNDFFKRTDNSNQTKTFSDSGTNSYIVYTPGTGTLNTSNTGVYTLVGTVQPIEYYDTARPLN